MRTTSLTGLMVATFAFALIAAACTSADDQAISLPARQPTTAEQPASESTPVAAAPTAVAVEAPTADIATGPSQSAADAERDGVPQVWADLSFDQRVDIWSEVEIKGQRWAISSLPFETLDDVGYEYFGEAGVDPSSGELIHIQDGRIVRSIYMPSAPPTWIVADGDLIFAGRQGDGGYPSSSIVRLKIRSGDVRMLWIPASYANRGWLGDGVWEFVAPEGRLGVLPALRAAIEAQGEGATDQVEAAVELLDAAVEGVRLYNPAAVPQLSLTNTQCPIDGYNGGLLYDFGASCAYQRQDDGDGPMVTVGTETIAGRLVGAGPMGTEGKSFAAVVATSPTGSALEPLVLIDVHSPGETVDTGINGRDEGSQIQQVSFSKDGFVVTFAVDQATSVRAFDTQGQPIDSFISPTDRDLGYPPDPSVDHAVVSPDGAGLAYVEREWPQDGSFLPGTSAALIVTLVAQEREFQRVGFELATNEYVQWVDFDGKWALVSLVRFDNGEAPSPPPVPFMVDIETGIVYPLGIDEIGATTLARAGLIDE